MTKKAVVTDRYVFSAEGRSAQVKDTTTGDDRFIIVDNDCEYDDMVAIEVLVTLANIGSRYVRERGKG